MNRSKQRGTAFESAVVEYLRDHGHPYAERRAQRGAKDCGDIAGVPGWVLECKALRELDVAGAIDEAECERANMIQAEDARREQLVAPRSLPTVRDLWSCAAILKRRRRGVGDAYVVMTLEQFARLLSEEG